MNNYKLYVHINNINGKRYYGITKLKPEHRWNNGKGYKGNQYFTRAIEKYGWDNITHEILFDDLTESEAKELEQYFIQWYDTANRDYGYNISLGGESSNHSEETRKKLSEAKKGENHPMYGKHLTEEHKQKLSKANKGKKVSKKTRKKMGEARKGKNNPRAKSVICLTTKRIFFTTADAARYYDMGTNAHIVKCCKGKQKSSGKHNGQKLVWKYLNYKHDKTYRAISKSSMK